MATPADPDSSAIPARTSRTPVEKLVRGFLDHLTVERGASVHTVAAYRRDLARYAAFLSARGIDDPAGVADADVSAFLASLQAPTDGHAPLSSASATRSLV
ncbi:MAG: site-specific integrase, partial [Propionibacteriaceae bacterium]|nr:site-specific integrase [Propionibacteriaceae bacterium]